jgi:putative flippase GtrA
MKTHLRQFYRYGVTGLLSNGILYVGYLVLTGLGLGPKLAASLVFAVGVTVSYILNSRWTFSHHGGGRNVYSRYWVAYGLAYVLNMSMLALLVDEMGLKHQVVQGVLVLVIALLLFLLQKYWVFRRTGDRSSHSPSVGLG